MACLLDDEQIERQPRNLVGVGEIPSRPADHAAVMCSDETSELRVRQVGPAPVDGVEFLGHPRAVDLGLEHIAEQVLDHRVRLRHHADPPPVLVHQACDHCCRGECLPRAGRSVHREIGAIKVQQRRRDVVGDQSGAGKWSTADRAGTAAQQDVRHRVEGQVG